MFRRKDLRSPPLVIAPPRLNNVRLLVNTQDLQEALERAEEFERVHGYRGRPSYFKDVSSGNEGSNRVVPFQPNKAS